MRLETNTYPQDLTGPVELLIKKHLRPLGEVEVQWSLVRWRQCMVAGAVVVGDGSALPRRCARFVCRYEGTGGTAATSAPWSGTAGETCAVPYSPAGRVRDPQPGAGGAGRPPAGPPTRRAQRTTGVTAPTRSRRPDRASVPGAGARVLPGRLRRYSRYGTAPRRDLWRAAAVHLVVLDQGQ